MPAVCRIGDPSSGDGDCVQGSPNVFANNLATTRLGDAFENGNLASASQTVFVNGIGIGKVGDTVVGLVTCNVVSGSPNVFAGG